MGIGKTIVENEIYGITVEEEWGGAGNQRNFRTSLAHSYKKVENNRVHEETKLEGYSSSSSSYDQEECERQQTSVCKRR